jgi:hypothetical protein
VLVQVKHNEAPPHYNDTVRLFCRSRPRRPGTVLRRQLSAAFDEPLLDDSGTQHVCQIFEGLSCPLGCVISGKRSIDIITRGRWDLECGLSSQIQEYDAEIDAKREASCF